MWRETWRVPVLLLSLVVGGACGGGGDDGGNLGPDAADTAVATGSIAGTVLTETTTGSEVVAGAVVTVAGLTATTTNDRGEFELQGMTPGAGVAIVVRGPRAADPDHPFVFSTYHGRVDVTADQTTVLMPVLVPGCERLFDAAAGATLDVATCGGAGRAQLVFPPAALIREAGGAGFAGLARLELAINDPAAPAQALALPALAPDVTDSELFGAIEVRLSDALTGEALQVAAGMHVEVSVEVSSTLAAGAAVYLFDPATHTWVAEPGGAVETRSGRTYYRFDADHFSQRAVAYIGGPIPNLSCVDYRITPSQGPRPPYLQLRSGGRWWIRQVTADGCVQAWPGAAVQVRALGWPLPGSPASIYSAWESTTTGMPVANSCGGSTPDCGDVTLHIGPEGCIDGTFASTMPACAVPGTTIPGQLRFVRDGRVFETRPAGNVCSAFFGTVMVPPGNGPVLIGDQTGSYFSWSPSFPGPSCVNLGAQSASRYGLFPKLYVSYVTRFAAGGDATDPGSAYGLTLDASTSEGMIHTYAWDLFQVGGGGEALVWSASTATPIASVDVDAGRYRVRLRIFAGASLVAETSTLKDVPGPSARFVLNPDPPVVDQVTTFDASTSTGGIATYAWDFDNDGTFDTTGAQPSATHTYTATGPVQVRLRVTDGNGAIDESVRDLVVQADLPPGTIVLTITGNGTVRENAGPFTCVGPATCQHTFPGTGVLLEARDAAGGPANNAWAGFPGADGYQAYFNFSTQPSYTVTASF